MSETAPLRRPLLPQVVTNVLSNWGGYLFALVVTFFLSPFVVHHLGNSAYGVWVLIVSLTGYLGLLDLGVRGAVTRYVARYHAQGDYDEANRIASSALTIFAGGGLLAFLLSIGLAVLAVSSFNIPEAYQSQARLVLPIVGITVAISLIGGVFGGILVALQRFDVVNLVQVISSGLRALVIVIALRNGKGIVALACIQLVFSSCTALTNAWMSYQFFPQLRIRLRYFNRQRLALIFSFSFYSFLLHVSAYLIVYTDAVVIGVFLPVSFVTFFSIAGNLVNYSRDLISGISGTMTPLASKLEAEGKMRDLQRVALNASSYATVLMLPIAITFMIRGRTFIGLWMGAEFANLSGRVLWILSISAIVSAGWQVGGSIMIGISKHKRLVPMYLAIALVNLGMSVVLVQKIGVTGVAWGTTIPDLVLCLVLWPWYVRRTLKIPVRTYALTTWVRPALAMVLFAIGSFFIEHSWPARNLLVFFSQVGAALPLALLGFWLICLTATERQNYSGRLLRGIGKAFGRA